MSLRTTTKHAANFCPACGYRSDSSTSIGTQAVPKPGDITLCIKCGEMNRFTQSLQLEPVPDDWLADLPLEERNELLDMEERIKSYIRYKKLIGKWMQ